MTTPAPDGPLHVEHYGAGPGVALVHGWGLHGGVWRDLLETLRPHWQVSVVELPGHGFSADSEPFDLPGLAHALAAALPGRRAWVGWSLGALACLQLALEHPSQVRGLGLLAATPRFTSAPDWPHGTAPELLQAFAGELERDSEGLLMRFLGLQVQGGTQPQGALKALRAHWAQRPAARLQGLWSGLEILRTADLRARLSDIVCPALVIAGERDRLVPPAASAALAAQLPHARYAAIAGAGHAPFVAQPALVGEAVSDFLRTLPPAQDGGGLA